MPAFGPSTLRRATTAGLALLGLAGCREVNDRIPRWLYDARTPRERYEARLAEVGLTTTAVARDWQNAAMRALTDAPLIVTPHAEEGYLTPAEPGAVAYRVEAKRGQEIAFEVRVPGDSTTQWFLDAWEIPNDTLPPRRLASADSGARLLTLRPRRDGEYVFRAQPELLRGGRFAATVDIEPTLAFPVLGGRESDILSRYGASRDGGRRRHQGIDIFAPRGTAALAAAEGTVVRVDATGLGGKVVWLRDRHGNALYYAHLDSQIVSRGGRVVPGDTVGFVGNTGNARTTPPHLHFGVYRRGEGAVDPYWFVHRTAARATALTGDTTLLGAWARTRASHTALLASPGPRADAVAELVRHTALRIVASAGEWFRVRLPDGGVGYLAARDVEPVDTALTAAAVVSTRLLLLRPWPNPTREDIRGEVRNGDSVAVLAEFGDFSLVRMPGGENGWLAR